MPTASVTAVSFLNYLFSGDEQTGWLYLATEDAAKGKKSFRQHFFEWPTDIVTIADFIDKYKSDHNIWYGVSLYSKPKVHKENCVRGNIVWADLDDIDPSDLGLPPSTAIESSPGRYQGIWRLADCIDPDIAEEFSRNIAYHFHADLSGWDMTQLLRVPGTLNFKYPTPAEVKILSQTDLFVPMELLEVIPEPSPEPGANTNGEIPLGPQPTGEQLAVFGTAAEIIREHNRELDGSEFIDLFFNEPAHTANWSTLLWRLINLGFEAGLCTEEVFILSCEAACNKYQRDNRPMSHLWRDVSKASINHKKFAIITNDAKYVEWNMPILTSLGADALDSPELPFQEDSFLQDYKIWADLATDAPFEYHELCCFVALSAMVCDRLRLETTFGSVIPNIWALILGESTLSRKTTAMNMAMNIIYQVDPELVLATEAGSAEGLLTSLSHRPARASIFFKDEVAGFFNEMNSKSYLAGFAETLTKLYDSPKVMTRILRKEVITVQEPYFIFFGGGISANVHAQITDEYIQSGFLPRFLVVDAQTDLSTMRPVGPPTHESKFYKDKVFSFFEHLKAEYHQEVEIDILGQKSKVARRFEAQLTPDAWELYNKYQTLLATDAHESPFAPTAIPTFLRMSFSLLKIAMLIAVTRHPLSKDGVLTVESDDVQYAAYYVQKWGRHTVRLVKNAGKAPSERLLDRIIDFIRQSPGVGKSEVAARFRLYSRDLKEIESTLVERGIIEYRTAGKRGVRRYWAIEGDTPESR